MAEQVVPQTGFVCPKWALPYWDQSECRIHPCDDGTHAVVDHSLNGVTIFVGNTEEDCVDFFKSRARA